jgi:hypothetical protein
MESTRTCCALTRLDPMILKVPSCTCEVGCPGAGSVADWPYANPKKRDKMYSEEKGSIALKKRERRKEGEEVQEGTSKEIEHAQCPEKATMHNRGTELIKTECSGRPEYISVYIKEDLIICTSSQETCQRICQGTWGNCARIHFQIVQPRSTATSSDHRQIHTFGCRSFTYRREKVGTLMTTPPTHAGLQGRLVSHTSSTVSFDTIPYLVVSIEPNNCLYNTTQTPLRPVPK